MSVNINMEALDKKIEELRAATREANECLAGVKETLREVKRVGEEVDNKVSRALSSIERDIEEKVKTELAELGEATKYHMDLSVEKVSQEFQKLQDILLGTGPEDNGRDQTIPELVNGLPDHPGGGKQYPGRGKS